MLNKIRFSMVLYFQELDSEFLSRNRNIPIYMRLFNIIVSRYYPNGKEPTYIIVLYLKNLARIKL